MRPLVSCPTGALCRRAALAAPAHRAWSKACIEQGATQLFGAGCTTSPAGLLTTSKWASSYTTSRGNCSGLKAWLCCVGRISTTTRSPALTLCAGLCATWSLRRTQPLGQQLLQIAGKTLEPAPPRPCPAGPGAAPQTPPLGAAPDPHRPAPMRRFRLNPAARTSSGHQSRRRPPACSTRWQVAGRIDRLALAAISKCSFTRSASVLPISAIFWPRARSGLPSPAASGCARRP